MAVTASGDWWRLEDGTLYIFCDGDMPDGYVYYRDYSAEITRLSISSAVTHIGNYTFQSFTALTSVTIPDSVTSIGSGAFYGCTSLISATIPDGVTSIGNAAFWNCSSLASVTIPDSVTSIESGAFYGCESLTSVTIPDGVTSIGVRTFCNNAALTSVTIPDSVTSIGQEAFRDCANLADVYYSGAEEEWNAITIASGNAPLSSAEIHYNSAPAPAAGTIPAIPAIPTANLNNPLAAVAQTLNLALQSLAATASGVNALIGSDANKSVRTIAGEELAAQLIPANAQASLDTLQEIAAWIQAHPADAAAINAKLTLGTHEVNGEQVQYSTVQDYVTAMVSGLITLTALSVAVSGNGNAVTSLSYNSATGAFTATKDATFLTEHQDISGKVDKISGKGLSTEDYTTAEKAAVATIGNKVDKVSGKGLSTEDYTTAEKTKVGNGFLRQQLFPYAVELTPPQGSSYGGYIDFHYGGSTADYTARLIENASGEISVMGKLFDRKGNEIVGSVATSAAKGFMSAADKTKLDESSSDVAAIKTLLQSSVLCRTASGNPAIFQDGAAANVRNLSVTLTPTQSGSGDPSPSNVRPISGVLSVTVTRTGKNLFSGLRTITPTGKWYVGTDAYGTNSSPISLPTGNLTISFNLSGSALPCQPLFFKPDGTHELGKAFASVANGRTVKSYNLDFIPVAFSLYIDHDSPRILTDLQLESGGAATAYEPYQGAFVAVALADSNDNPLTVYGGTLDVTAGTLTVTWANIASYNGETLPGRWMSDRDVYASGATPTTGAQVVYELATPVTYQLTAQQLATLSGYNAVSADCGTLEVEYRADVGLSLGGNI